jgi:hypothetical protein
VQVVETVGSGETASKPSLREDPRGNVHLAYAAGAYPSVSLRHAQRRAFAGHWNVETIDQAAVLWEVSLATGPGPYAHIAYVAEETLRQLRYATNLSPETPEPFAGPCCQAP